MRQSASRDLVVLVAGWLALAFLVDPRADLPLIDDWIYAVSVERLVAGEGLRFLAYTAAIPIVQVFWGALFALPAGFSHTALRISTIVASLAGVLAFVFLLRALALDARRSLLGAVTLTLYPVWFVLSFTFMTDVPCVTLIVTSLAVIVTGLRDERPGVITAGLAIAVLAFLIRPIAIAIPVAVLASALRMRGSARRQAAIAALVTVTAMAVAGFVVGRAWPVAGGDGGLGNRVDRLRYILLVSPVVYLEALWSMLAHVGLAALPVVVATAPSPRRWPWRTAAVLAAVAFVVSQLAPLAVSALRPEATWSMQEIGAARPLLQAVPAPTAWRWAAELLLTGVGLLSTACLIGRMTRAARDGVLADPRWLLLAAFGATSIAMCFVLWFFYDRYFLPLVPIAIAFALREPEPHVVRAATARRAADGGAAGWARRRTRLAFALLVLLALLDVTGTRDMLAYARTVQTAVDALRARGIAEHEIDAGYVQNAWRLYAHPENLAPGSDVDRDVPNLSSVARMPFVVANGPVPGYAVEQTFPVESWWAQGDGVVVLRRDDVHDR